MSDRPLRKTHVSITKASCLLCAALCLISAAKTAEATTTILCRPNLSSSHRQTLISKLRSITGWTKIEFDEQGALRLDIKEKPIGGSRLSRDLISAALSGSTLLVLEDASNHSDVVFARVVEGRWTRDAGSKPPVNIIQIDFADFSHIIGDEEAIASFNEGWAVLHEIAHVVYETADTAQANDLGECESLINRMRRECGLPERTGYFFGYFPGQERTSFATRYVRLAFDKQSSDNKNKKRSWILWDGALVGGLDYSGQIARK